MSEQPVRITGRLVVGFVIITLGVLFTLDNLGIADAGSVMRWWPLFPLGYGLSRLLGIGSPRRLPIGLIFTVGGAWLLLFTLGYTNRDPWDFWPLMLVVLGISMVMGSMTRSRIGAAGVDASSNLSAFALWSGVTRKVTSDDFRGGDITAIMGGHELDLRSAKIVQGSAVIDLFVMWGGVEMRVPEDWKVTCEGLVLMGGIEDKSKAPIEARGHLILKGLVMMGGVEIKN